MAIILIVSLFSLASALITNGIFKPTNPNADTAMQSQILSSLGRFNGQSFPLTLFGGVMSTILPIFVVILIANMVTDEYTDGSLKLPLLRQVSRNELLIGKLVSLTVVMILMMLFLKPNLKIYICSLLTFLWLELKLKWLSLKIECSKLKISYLQ